MTTIPLENVSYLHDATVCEFALRTRETGERELRLRLRCDADCGYDQWNGKTIQVLFVDPLIVNGELFGHMSNVDSFNSWGEAISDRITEQIERLKDVGIPVPKHLVELVFHSGSVFEVACDEIRFELVQPVAPNRVMTGASHNLPAGGMIDDALPIRNLGVDRIKVTDRGIGVVENHLSRFGSFPHNEAMLTRLRRISKGEIQAAAEDLNFYAHELRECVRMRNLGVSPDDFLNMRLRNQRRVYEPTHNATLLEYGIQQGTEAERLYHPFARQFIGRPWQKVEHDEHNRAKN